MKEKLSPHFAPGAVETATGKKYLVLFNDDVNTFDYVIQTLMEVCSHDPQQAEQCALITHLKGQCTVKEGSVIELIHPCTLMTQKGLTVKIK